MDIGVKTGLQIQRASDTHTAYEYGCDLRRVYPWPGVAEPFWGAGIASVRVGESTTLDQHDESETFIVISGEGKMVIDDESALLGQGDVVFIPKFSKHYFENMSATQPLVFISIFWDSPGARDRVQARIANGVDDL